MYNLYHLQWKDSIKGVETAVDFIHTFLCYRIFMVLSAKSFLWMVTSWFNRHNQHRCRCHWWRRLLLEYKRKSCSTFFCNTTFIYHLSLFFKKSVGGIQMIRGKEVSNYGKRLKHHLFPWTFYRLYSIKFPTSIQR